MPRHGLTRCALAALLSAVTACVSVPLPLTSHREVSGREITRGDVGGLSVGRSTRVEVMAKLGPPTLDWSAERTLVYSWADRRSRYALSSRPTAPLTLDEIDEGTRRHLLALQFDARDRLLRAAELREDSVHGPAPGLHEWVRSGLREQLAALVPGTATRADVRSALGEPRHDRPRPNTAIYQWENVNLLVLVVYDDAGRLLGQREVSRALVAQRSAGRKD